MNQLVNQLLNRSLLLRVPIAIFCRGTEAVKIELIRLQDLNSSLQRFGFMYFRLHGQLIFYFH